MTVLRDRAAAEICFVSPSSLTACIRDLDGIALEGAGQLRAVLLPPGIPAAAALPESAADPPQQQQQQPFAAAAAAAPTGQWAPGPGAPHDPRQKAQGDLIQQQQQQQQQQHGTSSSSSSNGKRVCRLELVGLFAEEPTFSVAAAIRGPNDGNIQYILEQAQHRLDIGIRGPSPSVSFCLLL